ncbi:MAG: leucyl/phenylalanyl-tRNA--protein transferase, partial [SAR324 cluster bacterium]|nr:leucyl/phenylalanyl-tRNA--protein transferase [SAR324 cluster bacterium]
VETWQDGELVGGVYGIALGRCFFGESMFSRRSNASKVALAVLSERAPELELELMDCQMTTQHLLSLGARELPRHDFLELVREGLRFPTRRGPWS